MARGLGNQNMKKYHVWNLSHQDISNKVCQAPVHRHGERKFTRKIWVAEQFFCHARLALFTSLQRIASGLIATYNIICSGCEARSCCNRRNKLAIQALSRLSLAASLPGASPDTMPTTTTSPLHLL